MTEPAFDQLLQRLHDAGVEFVLVGGLAVNAWGVVRGTKDVDIVVAPDSDNLKKVAEVAVAAHGHVQKGEVFVVQGLDGVRGAKLCVVRAVEAEILGVKVAVCSIEALKRMKRAAGRPRDRVDLEDLDATGN